MITVKKTLCPAVSNSMNGTYLESASAGTTKDFTIIHANGDPVTITTLSDSATSFSGSIPNSVNTDVYYNRPYIHQSVSYAAYDSGWRVLNGTNDYNDNIPNQALIQQIEFDEVNNRKDYLKYFNIWGHKFRFTGLTGGYYDEADGNYYTVDGVLSDKATEFPYYTGARALIVDNLTGLMISSERLGSQTWDLSMSDTPTRTDGGYTDWQTISYEESLLYQRADLLTCFVAVDRPPFNYTTSLMWLGDTQINSTTRALRMQYVAYSPISPQTKTTTGGQKFYQRVHLTTPVPQP